MQDDRGNLTFVENQSHIPFAIKRVYYLYDVPGGSTRGSHAHRSLHQLIIAVSGSFDVTIHNGVTESVFSLNRGFIGLYLPPMHWRTLENFSSGSVCLVLASEVYDENDYIRDPDEFFITKSG
jgi:glyoxylate utilization-related uncharacterized protein